MYGPILRRASVGNPHGPESQLDEIFDNELHRSLHPPPQTPNVGAADQYLIPTSAMTTWMRIDLLQRRV